MMNSIRIRQVCHGFAKKINFCSQNARTFSCIASKQLKLNEKNTAFKSLNPVSRIYRQFHVHPSLWNSTVSFKLSDIGEGIKEVEMKEWFIEVGDTVAQFDDICEVSSDKASVTITSRYDGVVKKLFYNVGDIAQVGDTLVDIEVEGEAVEEAVEEPSKEAPPTISAPEPTTKQHETLLSSSDKILATPAVRHFAKENNVSLSSVQGSGKDGRILKEDILKHTTPSHEMSVPLKAVKVTRMEEDTVEPIKGIRKAMYHAMTNSLTIPHFGYNDEYDLTKLVELRKRLKKEVMHSTGIKLSYMPFIVKATSLALRSFPILNSQIDGENMVFKADHNISLAVDTPHGLLIPSIKKVQDLSILEVAEELNRLHEAGLNNKLTPADLKNGTFSLSNIGNIGGTYASPVIFSPQVAIGALGRIQAVPRFDRDDNIVKAHIMCVSWSGDHRIIEGATMARFSNQLKQYLEEPTRMLFHLK